eukprot:scpid67268/ scgid16386/ 
MVYSAPSSEQPSVSATYSSKELPGKDMEDWVKHVPTIAGMCAALVVVACTAGILLCYAVRLRRKLPRHGDAEGKSNIAEAQPMLKSAKHGTASTKPLYELPQSRTSSRPKSSQTQPPACAHREPPSTPPRTISDPAISHQRSSDSSPSPILKKKVIDPPDVPIAPRPALPASFDSYFARPRASQYPVNIVNISNETRIICFNNGSKPSAVPYREVRISNVSQPSKPPSRYEKTSPVPKPVYVVMSRRCPSNASLNVQVRDLCLCGSCSSRSRQPCRPDSDGHVPPLPEYIQIIGTPPPREEAPLETYSNRNQCVSN